METAPPFAFVEFPSKVLLVIFVAELSFAPRLKIAPPPYKNVSSKVASEVKLSTLTELFLNVELFTVKSPDDIIAPPNVSAELLVNDELSITVVPYVPTSIEEPFAIAPPLPAVFESKVLEDIFNVPELL